MPQKPIQWIDDSSSNINWVDDTPSKQNRAIEPTWLQSGISTGLRVIPAVGGGLLGMFGGPMGAAAMGAGGAALGNVLGQKYEHWAGLRPEGFNPYEFGVETALGAVPGGLLFKAPAKTAGKAALSAYAKRLPVAGAAEGAIINAAGTPFQQWAQTGDFDASASDYLMNAGMGAGFGGATGYAFGTRPLNKQIAGMAPPAPVESAPAPVVPVKPPSPITEQDIQTGFDFGPPDPTQMMFNEPRGPAQMEVRTPFDERFEQTPAGIVSRPDVPETRMVTPEPIYGPEIGEYGLGEGQQRLPLESADYKSYIDPETGETIPTSFEGQQDLGLNLQRRPSDEELYHSYGGADDVEGDHIIQVEKPTAEGNALLRQQGYERYGVNPETGKVQMILRANRPQRPIQTPVQAPIQPPPVPGQPLRWRPDGTVTVTNPSAKFVAGMVKQGAEIVGDIREGVVTFKKAGTRLINELATGEEGTFSPVEMWENLKRMLGRDPTPEEVERGMARQPQPNETTGRVIPSDRFGPQIPQEVPPDVMFPDVESVDRLAAQARADNERVNQEAMDLFGYDVQGNPVPEQNLNIGPYGMARPGVDLPRQLPEGQLDLPMLGMRNRLENITNAPPDTPVDLGPVPEQQSLFSPTIESKLRRLMDDETGAIPLTDYFEAWKKLGRGAQGIYQKIADRIQSSTARDWAAKVDELDATDVPDEAYHSIMPDTTKPLGPNETWRERALNGIKFFESKTPNVVKEFVKDETGAVALSDIVPDIEGKKKLSKAKEIYNLSRGLTTSMDLSAPLRQGLPMMYSKSFWKALGPMLKAGYSEEAFNTINTNIRDHDNFAYGIDENGNTTLSFGEKAGIKLMDLSDNLNRREEATASEWAEKIPGIRASNRAYTTFLNKLRSDSFNTLVEDAMKLSQIDPNSKNPMTDMVFAKNIADYVNTATGRGPLRGSFVGEKEHSLEQHAKLLTDTLFSPRLLASRMRLMSPGTYIMAEPFVRKQYLKAALTTAGAWGTIAALAKGAGAEVSTDTNSSDFGKIKIGNTRIDPGGGFQQFLVAASRLFTGEYTSSATQREFTLGQGYRAETRLDVAQRFGANKLHPVLKFGYDLLNASGRQPVNMMDRTAQMFVPLIAQDAIELAQEDPSLLPLLGPIGLGMGTQTYEKGETRGRFISPENDISFEGGPIQNLWSD
jgi:hypothetical protein